MRSPETIGPTAGLPALLSHPPVCAILFTCITRPLGLQLSGLLKMKPSRKQVPITRLLERVGQIETNSAAKICGGLSRMVTQAAPP